MKDRFLLWLKHRDLLYRITECKYGNYEEREVSFPRWAVLLIFIGLLVNALLLKESIGVCL